MKLRDLIALTCLLSAVAGCGSNLPNQPLPNMETAQTLRSSLEEGAGGGGAAAVELAEPTGWATLRGVFKVNGSPPARTALSQATTHQDAAVCAAGGKPPLSEEVVVGPEGGLSGVAVFLATTIPGDNPKWLHDSYAEKRGTEVIFDQRNCIFTTHVCGMWTAQTLKVLNSDPIGHNTKIDPKGGARPFNQTIGANGSTTYEPGGEERAPAPVSCSIHPWMKAYLLPRDNPYFAVTNEKGEFEIPNVPAGVELEFRVWQPHLEFVDGTVEVNGKSEKISKGRITLTLNDGESHDYNVTMDAGLFQ